MSPQIYSGEGGGRGGGRGGRGWTCSLLLHPLFLHPCPLPPSSFLFTSFFYYYFPLYLSPTPPSPLLPPTRPFLPHWGAIPPTLFRRSQPGPDVWAVLIALGEAGSLSICLPRACQREPEEKRRRRRRRGERRKGEEQRSSFITMAINNANSAAVAAGEAGERKGCRDQGWGCVVVEGCRRRGPTGARQ